MSNNDFNNIGIDKLNSLIDKIKTKQEFINFFNEHDITFDDLFLQILNDVRFFKDIKKQLKTAFKKLLEGRLLGKKKLKITTNFDEQLLKEISFLLGYYENTWDIFQTNISRSTSSEENLIDLYIAPQSLYEAQAREGKKLEEKTKETWGYVRII